VVALDDDERLYRGRAGGALAPAPASGAHDASAVDEDDFAGVRMDDIGRSEICEGLCAGGKTDGGEAGDVGTVEYGDGRGIANRDEVADVDEGVDREDVAMLGKLSEQCFGGVAVLGRFGAESG
jgi:hypothetical protein